MFNTKKEENSGAYKVPSYLAAIAAVMTALSPSDADAQNPDRNWANGVSAWGGVYDNEAIAAVSFDAYNNGRHAVTPAVGIHGETPWGGLSYKLGNEDSVGLTALGDMEEHLGGIVDATLNGFYLGVGYIGSLKDADISKRTERDETKKDHGDFTRTTTVDTTTTDTTDYEDRLLARGGWKGYLDSLGVSGLLGKLKVGVQANANHDQREGADNEFSAGGSINVDFAGILNDVFNKKILDQAELEGSYFDRAWYGGLRVSRLWGGQNGSTVGYEFPDSFNTTETETETSFVDKSNPTTGSSGSKGNGSEEGSGIGGGETDSAGVGGQ